MGQPEFPKGWGIKSANCAVYKYLQEKENIGLVSGVNYNPNVWGDVIYYIHYFTTTQKYFNSVLCFGLAQLCCSRGLVPWVLTPFTQNLNQPHSWVIRFSRHIHLDIPLTEKHVPLIAEHLRNVYDVMWEPGEV